MFVSVGVASRQLLRPELVNEMRHVLGRAVMPKGSLRLEIAESLVMENPEKARALLEQLAAAGAGLSLDEFGTGYSSLPYISQFAFDTIKVDRAYVQARGQNASGGTMLRSIVALAKELGRKVSAEGVEAEDDIVFLRSIGCEFAQGLLLRRADVGPRREPLLKDVRRAERRMKRGRMFRSGAKPRPEGSSHRRASLPANPPHCLRRQLCSRATLPAPSYPRLCPRRPEVPMPAAAAAAAPAAGPPRTCRRGRTPVRTEPAAAARSRSTGCAAARALAPPSAGPARALACRARRRGCGAAATSTSPRAHRRQNPLSRSPVAPAAAA